MATETTQIILPTLVEFSSVLLATAWLIVFWLVLWTAWRVFKILSTADYVGAIQWTCLQITIPEDNPQTPKSMENAFEVWAGVHKAPDVIEKFFEGYLDAWYSCEIHCEPNRVRYIMVVPTLHRKFFEGVIYGQYPAAEVREVEDYTQNYNYQDLEQKYDLFGSEIILARDDFFPIRTYEDFADELAEDDKYIDPHQAMIEAFTNIHPGEEFWVQILIRPVDSKVVDEWVKKGEKEVGKIAGTEEEKASSNLIGKSFDVAARVPGDLFKAVMHGPLTADAGASKSKDLPGFHLYTPVDDAKMKGIVQKISHNGYKVKIRVMYMSPPGKFRKPAQSIAIGAFKQFNTFHLNSFKPDSATKTSGPAYFLKNQRRRLRKRKILLLYQWRDFWGADSGYFLTANELATLYHFPGKYLRAPVVERSLSGLGSAPENLPYA